MIRQFLQDSNLISGRFLTIGPTVLQRAIASRLLPPTLRSNGAQAT